MKSKTTTTKATRNQADKSVIDQLRAENSRLRAQLNQRSRPLEDRNVELPPLPSADENGHYPAIETARAIIAHQMIRGRKLVGWTQAELAARAGVRQETISRIETGKHSPGLKTMAKIDEALKNAGAGD